MIKMAGDVPRKIQKVPGKFSHCKVVSEKAIFLQERYEIM